MPYVFDNPKSQMLVAMTLEEIANEDKILQRFGHFLALGGQESRVHPVAGHGSFPRDSFHLGNFGFVVGKDKVAASAVDIVLGAKKLFRDGRVFNVPAGSATAPRR